MKLALIGKSLKHSFSKDIHSKMGLDYSHVELEEENLKDFFIKKEFDGFNITIPYKEKAYNLCDELDTSALKIGAVNTVKVKDGKTIGYNTDIDGMRYMLKRKSATVKDKHVLILGSGGASKTAKAMCLIDGAKDIKTCSRTGEINYSNVYESAKNANVLINCTPVGTYPNSSESPIDLSKFDELECVLDCVYNPVYTRLIEQAKSLNIKCENGLSMLVYQALKAEEIWQNVKIQDQTAQDLISSILREKLNIVLIGMPSSGKSTVATKIAQILQKEVCDTDKEIEKEYGLPSKIIESRGEEYFRKIESEIIKKVSAQNGKIIATGGGAILLRENRQNLKQNAIIIYLDRDIDKLVLDNRPLSKSKGLDVLYKERAPIYNAFCDLKVDNNNNDDKAVKEIINFYENFSN